MRNTLLFACSVIPMWLSAQWTWVQRPSLGSGSAGRWGTAEFVIDGKAYVVGGRMGTSDLTEVWAYDPVADAWEAKSPIPGQRRLAAAFAINGKGYVTCGLYQTSSMLNDLYEYDPVTDAWTQRAPLPDDARYSSAAFAVGGKGYVVGGNLGGANGPYSSDCWAYDPSNNTWSSMAPIPGQSLFAARGFTADGKGHVLGGRLADQTFTNALWQYDPVTNAWASKAPLPGTPRTYSYAWSLEYHGLIMGGDNLQGEQLIDLWRYLPGNNTWTSFTPYAGGANWGGAAFAINGRVYAGLGRQGTSVLGDLWELREAFVGMAEPLQEPPFRISPNPCSLSATMRLEIAGHASGEASVLMIHNSAGQMAHQVQLDATGRASIELPALAPGIYTAILRQGMREAGRTRLVLVE
jgi:N-acetylneuraminic acid mutarotase